MTATVKDTLASSIFWRYYKYQADNFCNLVMKLSTDRLLTIGEVAKILRVSTRSVNRYITSGKLKASKIGWWRIKQSDLNEFLEKTSNIRPRRKK